MSRYTKSKIEELVNESKSKAQVLGKLGLHRNGNNSNMLQKIIDGYNIDISHFDYHKNTINNATNFIKHEISEILVENSTYYSTSNLKKRLYKEGLKERKCEKCGQGEEWNGEKMSLILDHINGINNDNRIENLRILCPNCNATLPTHAGKNTKKSKKIYYCNCGNEMNRESKQCKKCYDKSRINRKKRPTYEQLLKEIDDFGYCGTGRKYGVSDTSIRKWKKNYEQIE